MSRFFPKNRYTGIPLILVVLAAIAVATSSMLQATATLARPVQPRFNHFLSTHFDDEEKYEDGPEQEQYDNRAFPQMAVSYDQVVKASGTYQTLVSRQLDFSRKSSWEELGPFGGPAVPQATYTGRSTAISGRITSLAVARDCSEKLCRVWVGAAGGGIWVTEDGLAPVPHWRSSSGGLPTNAIGSITIDPTDRSGKTLYVGTGEPNGSSDSEAGVGLFKSTNYGNSWQLVSGSVPVSKDRSVASVAIDPKNARHIYMGTAVARHGSSAVNGGRFTPPHAPVVGLYESRDGGLSFKLVFSKEGDVVNPGTPNGSDFFRGGVSKVEFDRTGLAENQASRLYFSVFDYGLYRTNSGSFEQVFASAGGGTIANSATSRTEFALAPNKGKLRIYLGDVGSANADFYRVDDASVPAATLTDGKNNPGWTKLSNSTKGTPGFSSYNYCGGQCSYDMPVASPPGHPDEVWIGGQMQYDEIFTTTPPSNGRTIQRSVDAGASFTDMTNDTQTPPLGMHPDQHAIAFDPNDAGIAFTGSDGGLVRTSGKFADASSDCNNRGISGADLTDCKLWLSSIPVKIFSMNAGLATIQFQSVTFNPKDPRNDLIGGTQDNGTWAFKKTPDSWFESVGGDGGQSVIDAGNPDIRMHTYFGPSIDVNFKGTDPNDWNYISDPLTNSKEAASFYVPLIGDPTTSQTMYVGLEHVWRTQDSGGQAAYLRQHCNELTGDFKAPCGDWVAIGQNLVDTTFGADKGGSYVVALTRAKSTKNVLWTATRRGRLFISQNADAAPDKVRFTRIDTAAQPTRFVSGIAVDPKNPYHAFVSFSGYEAYTPDTPGHVFEVNYDPNTAKATWKDISYNLGDMPVTGIAYDSHTGHLYIANDFSVLTLHKGINAWTPAAAGLPRAAVYNLTLSDEGRVLYAATHGRGAWRLKL